MSTLLAFFLLSGCGNDVAISKQHIDDDDDGYDQRIDCDDAHASVNPDAEEICDGLDNDCNGEVDDDASDAPLWFEDGDGDGWGDATVHDCNQPEGTVTENGDCDDANAAIHPEAPEHCDGVDEDCDGTVDEDTVDAIPYYVDADGDGYGAALAGNACSGTAGQSAKDGDCDDANAAMHPGAPESDCSDPVDYNCDGSVMFADDDGDGSAACNDCNDADRNAHPGATESCDGTDEDCDGTVDNGVLLKFYRDGDNDAYGDAGLTTEACSPPFGYVTDDMDCDDGDATIYPGAAEWCDGLDHDCDGQILESGSVDATLWYPDDDADTYGALAGGVYACTSPVGRVASASDCDDQDAAIHPSATEICDGIDQDCDGTADDGAVDAAVWYADQDGDRFGDANRSQSSCNQPVGYVSNQNDCDDTAVAINPAATEVCDPANTDENCDGLADDNDPGATGQYPWYTDSDHDGFGGSSATLTCERPAGTYPSATDCNDADGSIHPNATEICDPSNTDENCDNLADDNDPGAAGKSVFYLDADNDTYGGSTSLSACDQPTGYRSTSTDCNDANAAINPGATEICDTANTDEDCDTLADDNDPSVTGRSPWYLDQDHDTYAGTSSTLACDQAAWTYPTSTDCNDNNAAINPGAAEICDTANTDEDCDTLADDNDPSVSGKSTWYADADLDNYGGTNTLAACDQPANTLATSTDCNDANAAINPGATEICDTANTDEDCDTLADDNDPSVTGRSPWYLDQDHDTYAGTSSTLACEQPVGSSTSSTDCDDNNTAINPGATEICDAANTDEDCDTLADDADPSASGKSTWYADADHDNYGGTSILSACDQPANYLTTSTDCNDANAAINPGATEICDTANTDEDCDTLADDNDPSATGKTTWYLDNDADGYGGTANSACEQPSNSYTSSTDCNDSSATINPGATEVCSDGIDQDCSGADAICVQWSGTESADLSDDTKIYGFVVTGSLGAGLAAGDFDGDGTGDLVVGDPDYNYNSYFGTVFGYYGPLTSGEWQAANHDNFLWYAGNATISGTYGATLTNIGDISGDGKEDLVVYGTIGLSGLYYGGDSTTASSIAAQDRALACSTASRLGNWNSSSANDAWACASHTYSSSKGIVYVYSGTGTSVINSYTGESNNDYAGYGVAAGDFDGDGLDDLAIGAYADDDTASDAGAVYIVYAGNMGTVLSSADNKILGGAISDNLGKDLEVFEDLNNDGYADLAVGAPSQDGGAANGGAVYLITAPTSGVVSAMAWATITGTSLNENVGSQAIEKGDFDGNGTEDLVLGVPNADSLYGAAFLFYSPSSGSYSVTTADAIWKGVGSQDYFGWAVAPVPDINGDGKAELAISATNGESSFRANTGAVWLYLAP